MLDLINLGDKVLKKLNELPKDPGIYKFLNAEEEIIYIGKAKNISKRTRSYFLGQKNKSKKLDSLISESRFLDITLTSTELEALLLEQHSIKEHRPKFNVKFKDDKGYPWIEIGISKEYPSANTFFGKKKKGELYYGPFPNSQAAKDTLGLIQRIFKLRDCSDSFFKNRSRPCMQYQIGKCSAPCVSAIKKNRYIEEVKCCQMLLEGKGEDLINKFYESMDKSAEKKLYERAAFYRNKISSLRDIQRTQSISGFSKDRDAVVVFILKKQIRIGVTSVRGGWIVGHENFIKEKEGLDEEIMGAFISSHFLFSKYCPPLILIQEKIGNKETLQKALSEKHSKKIQIITRTTKKDKGLINICIKNTKVAFKRREKKVRDLTDVFFLLKKQLELLNDIRTIESYDISHHSGKNAIGVNVVFNKEGKCKDLYRVYNINKDNSGNDIASMREVIRRRFRKGNKKKIPKPDLLLIDGGYNHLMAVKDELKLMDIIDLEVISISKGSRRKPQMDSIHKEDGTEIKIKRNSKAHLLLQEIRDESHRFSIMRQRRKELTSTQKSYLDSIKGVGKNRKSSLLRYFGSVDQISRASSQDLAKVPGIGKKTSKIIYTTLH